MKPFKMTALFATTALLVSACAVAPEMNEQELQIKSDLAVDNNLPATRQMRDAIETQPIFAQAAFWSNEYNLNPGDLESAIKLAAAVRKLGNPNRAIEITQTTRALYPRDPYLVAEYAAALIAAERSVDAMQPLDQALAMTPAYGRLWSLKGAALDQQERYGEARQYYQRALQITPNDPNVLANIGFSYALSGDAVTAEQWLRRAVNMPGASPSVRQNLALVLKLQGKIEEAEKMVALTRGPQNIQIQAKPALRPVMSQTQLAQPKMGQPQARMSMGPAQGQNYSSAAEAARAMANQKTGERIAPVQSQTSAEAQQAMLDRISRNLQTQPTTTTPLPSRPQTRQAYPQAQQMPPQAYAPLQAAPPQAMAGGPVQQQTQQAPARRQANRRRR